jgi:transcriptional regulator with XRE-family HTH domain
MTLSAPRPQVGELIRSWRQRRRRSQLDLALDADVSARHLSFVETGRSQPSRELLLHLAEQLDVPLRERNALLLAGGYAPVYRETPLDTAAMAPVRAALDQILAGHEPFPAVIVDGRWDLVAGNRSAVAFLGELVAPSLLAPPINTLRVSLHPDGLARHLINLAEYSAHLLLRLRRQALASGDPALTALHHELREYPGVVDATTTDVPPAALLFMPMRVRRGDDELSFFSTLATFGTALDITIADLAIESFFPADATTDAALRAAAAAR